MRVAIVGVANRASSLVHNIEYYKNAAERKPQLLHIYMKSPPKQFSDYVARNMTEEFINENQVDLADL